MRLVTETVQKISPKYGCKNDITPVTLYKWLANTYMYNEYIKPYY